MRRLPARNTVVTIGMFDGVHVGHQRLIRTAIRLAARLRAASVVLTFDPDPQTVLAPRQAQPRLMPLAARLRLMRALGVERIRVLPFTRAFSRLSAEQFVRTILVHRLRAACVVVGNNFAFGRARRGNVDVLRLLGRRYGLRVVVVPPVRRGGAPVSSSRIRRLLETGRIVEANRLLGRPAQLAGVVVRGDRRARRLGFPTANLRLSETLPRPANRASRGGLPPRGVYHVRLEVGGRCHEGVMNLGVRPTFGPPARRSRQPGRASAAPRYHPLVCEVHLVGFRGNVYGRSVTVHLLRRLRPERRFASAEALARQIRRDVLRVRR